jgi:uncharacterized protein YkwD
MNAVNQPGPIMIFELTLAVVSQLAQPAAYRSAADDAAAARRLAEYINQERAADGLPPVAVSPSLVRVARAHVRDLMQNRPDSGTDYRGRRCTMHSWSAAGRWTPVCFTADNAYAPAMWNKPKEITGGQYRDAGVEIAYRMPAGVTPEIAMDGWLNSAAHEAVMLERGPWRSSNWQAMGVAIDGDYAVAWFGKEPDEAR